MINFLFFCVLVVRVTVTVCVFLCALRMSVPCLNTYRFIGFNCMAWNRRMIWGRKHMYQTAIAFSLNYYGSISMSSIPCFLSYQTRCPHIPRGICFVFSLWLRLLLSWNVENSHRYFHKQSIIRPREHKKEQKKHEEKKWNQMKWKQKLNNIVKICKHKIFMIQLKLKQFNLENKWN